jgi:hypothetical protein
LNKHDPDKMVAIRATFCSLGALALPFIVQTAYLARRGSAKGDWVALLIAVLAGAICILGLPTRVWLRAVLVVLYIPVVVALIAVYSLMWVCLVQGDCL